MNSLHRTATILLAGLWAALGAAEDQAPHLEALARMPVKEVTVFKDGHAVVLHQGAMPTDVNGNVLMDYLPTPILGTFWPYATGKTPKLTSVTAGQRRVTVKRTPLTIRELIEAHPGEAVIVTEISGASYDATIVGVAQRSSQELEAVAPPNSGEMLPQKGDLVLLKTVAGVKVLALARIQDVTFKEAPKNPTTETEFRNLLTLRLDWDGRKPTPTADVGLAYVQRGIRWIPHYKVTLDGKGSATVQLQASLLNELTDLQNVTAHLVIGVPTFQFKDTTDPMALQQTLASLSPYFREADPTSGQYQMLSNALMTQTTRMSDHRQRTDAGSSAGSLGPELEGAETVEDLHIFTVKNVTLKKGERMIVPVTEFTVPYRDIYTLDLPFAPPNEVLRSFNTEQQSEITRLLAAPKAMHKLRLTNDSGHPFTTAPALIVQSDRVLGQGLMTYTSKGGTVDLPITAALDVRVKKSDSETLRTPNAAQWDGNSYVRVDLRGTVALTNFRKEPVAVEITRHVLGNITEADSDGVVAMVNVFEDSTYASVGSAPYPSWWGWWNWPHWWGRFNGVGRITWTATLEPGASHDFTYAWNYFWR